MRPALQVDVLIAHFPYGGNGGIASEIPQIRQWEVQTALKAKSDPRIKNFYTQDFSDTPITFTRNKAIRCAKEIGAHFLLMIDSDNDPLKHVKESWHKPFWDVAFDFLYERYSKGPHLIFAPYCGAPEGKENCYVFRWHDYGNHAEETEFSLEQYLREEAALMSGIHEAAAGPTGMLMMDIRCADLVAPRAVSKRRVLEDVAAGTRSVSDALCDLKEGWFYYEWQDQRADVKASTEDVTFTRDVSLAGVLKLGYNPVHCAWDSWVGHHKPWNVGKPQRWMPEQVGAALRRAVLDDHPSNERIIETGALNKGDDPLSRRLREMAKQSEDAFRANGSKNGKRFSIKPNEKEEPVELLPPTAVWPETGLMFNVEQQNGHRQRLVHPGPWDKAEALRERLSITNSPVLIGNIVEIDTALGWQHLRRCSEQSIDYLICRGLIETLDDPLPLIREISRVAKAGWIECTSPLVETAHGLDGDGKGYASHKNIVWSSGSKLCVMPKLPELESLPILERHDLLQDDPCYWNTYHLWTGPLEFIQHGPKFKQYQYEFLLRDACRTSICASRELYKLATGEEPPELKQFPWYDGLGTPTEHTEFLEQLVKVVAYRKGEKPRVLEVGSLFGKTAIAMADAGATVHCVDHWQGSPTDPSGFHVKAAGGPDEVYGEFLKHVGDRLNKTIFPWRMSSAEAAAMSWQRFDHINIDAEHTYEACKDNILEWWQHLRDDGSMSIHDYMTLQFPGVKNAIHELFGPVECHAATGGHGGFAMVKKADYPELCCAEATG